MGQDEIPELDTLLEAFLQNANDREQGLQELVQQQKVDLQALHHGLEQSTSQQHKQQACFDQMQVRPYKHLLCAYHDDTDQAALSTLKASHLVLLLSPASCLRPGFSIRMWFCMICEQTKNLPSMACTCPEKAVVMITRLDQHCEPSLYGAGC